MSQTMKPQPETTSSPSGQMRRIDRLFLRFSAMYGHVWRSIYKTDEFLAYTKKTWFEALKDFEDKSIEYALSLCLKTCPLPPTLPQFIENCKAYHSGVIFKAQNSIPKASPEVALVYLEKIKSMLNNRSKQ